MGFFVGTLSTVCLLLLCATVLLNGTVAAVLLFRQGPNRRADAVFATLLLAYALTCVHHALILQGVFHRQPQLAALPLYFTLAFGVLLFFSVKLRLFPAYRFVGSDIKHALLPVGQFLYFLLVWLFADWNLERRFYSPFYGGLEMAFYIFTFYTYQFAAYRYVQYKISALRKQQQGGQLLYETLVMRRMLRVMLVLFWVNSGYIVTDFVMYELLQLNMHNFRGFTRFGDLSFVAMAGWAGLTGIQLLLKPPYLNLSTLVFKGAKKLLRLKP